MVLSGEIIPKDGKIAQRWGNLNAMESVPGCFLSNKVHRIHWEHVLELVLNTEVSRGKHWPVGWCDARDISSDLCMEPWNHGAGATEPQSHGAMELGRVHTSAKGLNCRDSILRV